MPCGKKVKNIRFYVIFFKINKGDFIGIVGPAGRARC